MTCNNASRSKKLSPPRRRGISWQRHIFSGINTDSGGIQNFFVEYIAVNPAPASDQVVLNRKPEPPAPGKRRPGVRSEPPRYILVRAGSFGPQGIIFENFAAPRELVWNKKENLLFFKQSILGPSELSGAIKQSSVIYSLFSDSRRKDTFAWNFAIKDKALLNAHLRSRGREWFCSGAYAALKGSVKSNNDQAAFASGPILSYSESFSSKEIPSYWFHISAMHLISKITNGDIKNSCVIAHSFQKNSAAVFLNLEGQIITFKPANSRKYAHAAGCTRTDGNLHWNVSTENKRYMLDIDMFCAPPEMKLLGYDSPAGKGSLLSVFSGATGAGELRLYRRLKKGLELLVHADILNARCEYGVQDIKE